MIVVPPTTYTAAIAIGAEEREPGGRAQRALEPLDRAARVPARDERRHDLVDDDEREADEQREAERHRVGRDVGAGREHTDEQEVELGEQRAPDRHHPHRRLERVVDPQPLVVEAAQLAVDRPAGGGEGQRGRGHAQRHHVGGVGTAVGEEDHRERDEQQEVGEQPVVDG